MTRPGLVSPHPRQQREIAEQAQRIIVLQQARESLEGTNLSATDGLDMLIESAALRLNNLTRNARRTA